jgi:ribosomal protein S18 acetylase RimI-like enzyme
MEVDLQQVLLPAAHLPDGFDWRSWRLDQAPAHAAVLFEGFRGELDSMLLDSLRRLEDCDETVRITAFNHRFLPEATWLVTASGSRAVPCAALQTIGVGLGVARIQNLAVLPEHRGLGIGRALILKALRQCRGLGIRQVQLDVTEVNQIAVRLYRSLGFRVRRSYFRNCRE